MFNFLLGLVVGWLAGSWYSSRGRRATPIADFRRKASGAIAESQRLVDESRREFQAALEGEPPERNRRQRRREGAGGD
ncbi:MAG TPA: hypothetical protein VFC93_01275 [Chloroflexota bacterium]|nr:hypothetical protein [Chloroflexota bacterium]